MCFLDFPASLSDFESTFNSVGLADSCLPYRDDITHHIIEGQCFQEISRQMLAEIMCGMLNSGL